jgi:predicted RNase H-like HicB family nuclease
MSNIKEAAELYVEDCVVNGDLVPTPRVMFRDRLRD